MKTNANGSLVLDEDTLNDRDLLVQISVQLAHVQDSMSYMKKDLEALKERSDSVDAELDKRLKNLETLGQKRAADILSAVARYVGMALLGWLCFLVARALNVPS